LLEVSVVSAQNVLDKSRYRPQRHVLLVGSSGSCACGFGVVVLFVERGQLFNHTRNVELLIGADLLQGALAAATVVETERAEEGGPDRALRHELT
jgi:hypothetical protein